MARPPKLTPGQLIEIEARYRSSIEPLRQIAEEYGINEASIRDRAKRYGWVREPAEAKRALVEAKLAGITTQSSDEAKAALFDQQAELDAETLRDSAEFYRAVIKRARKRIEEEESELLAPKSITETVKLATEGYMRVRGLDKTDKGGASWDSVLPLITRD